MPGRDAVARSLAQEPVVVTGMGCWAPGASDPDALFRAALTAMSPARFMGLSQLPEPIAACVAPDPDLARPEARPFRRLDRSAAMAWEAARGAMAAAGLVPGDVDAARVGVSLGTSRGSTGAAMRSFTDLEQGRGVAPSSSAETTVTSIVGAMARSVGAFGPAEVLMATCSSAANAIAGAASHLVLGDADVMLAGGTEAPIVPLLAAQLRAAGVVGEHADPALTCRPFDRERNGLVLGEGAGVLVLERASTARARGATPLATLAGWSVGMDAGGRTGITPDGDGLVRVTRAALARADLAPDSIGYVNAHGTGTQLNDPVECRALRRVFGDGRVPPTSSTKPVTGHSLGATPALEAIIAIEAMRAGCLPPTANLRDPDPACDIDLVVDRPRPTGVDAVLSTSLGFWGMTGALVFTA